MKIDRNSRGTLALVYALSIAAGAEAVGIRGLVFQDAAQLRRDLDRILSE